MIADRSAQLISQLVKFRGWFNRCPARRTAVLQCVLQLQHEARCNRVPRWNRNEMSKTLRTLAIGQTDNTRIYSDPN